MAVVRALGKQHLWVDRYCIDQQDHNGKALQIRNMDRIYEGAYATIVASAGSSAHFRLPGVGLITRKCQPSAVVGGQVLVSSPPPLASALKESAWMKRGWTYQEATLSRRCLFFTELQVYFLCRGMNCSESIVRCTNGLAQSTTDATPMLRAGIFGRLSRSGAVEYCLELRLMADHITEYSSRSLTYSDDVLNAFRGLLARSQFHKYFGLPIATSNSPGEMTTDRD